MTTRRRSLTDVTRAELARIFDVDVRSLANYVDEGMPKTSRGRFPLAACVQWYVKRERAARRVTPLDTARSRKADVDAERAVFALEQMKGEWVRKEDYRAEFRRVLTAINGILELAPGRHGPKLPGDATVAEKVLALRGVVADVRAAMRNAGAPDETTPDARANP